MIAAAETTTPTSIVARQADATFAIGLATTLTTCKSAQCAAECD